MEAPLVLFIIVIVVLALFLVNYFFVCAVRRWAEEEALGVQEDEGLSAQEEGDRKDSGTATPPGTPGSRDTQGTPPRERPAEPSTPVESSRMEVGCMKRVYSWCQRHVYALLFDSVLQERSSIQTFPSWDTKKTSWNKKLLAKVSTVTLVIGSSFIMSPQLVLTNASQPLVKNTAPDFCSTQEKADKVAEFENALERATNKTRAKNQTTHLLLQHSSLTHDVSLYGEGEHTCRDINGVPGNKKEYYAQEKHAKSGPFFPGFCEEALKAAIDLARKKQCEKWVCARIRKFGITWKKKCVKVYEACPSPTDEEEAALEDYRSVQLDIINDRIAEGTGVDFSEEFIDAGEDTYDSASNLLIKILHQVDVASFLYIFYACITLFFPTPIVLFKSSWNIIVKRFFFGANKYQFITIVVFIWWAVEYYKVVWFNPELRLYGLTMLKDPCFVDGDFVRLRRDALEATCDEMLVYANNFTTYSTALDHLSRQTEMFVGTASCCDNDLPYSWLKNVATAQERLGEDYLRGLGFTVFPEFMRNYGGILFPSENIAFVGNTTVCTDPIEAQRIILETNPEAEVNFWDLWIKTGLIASLLIKVVLANLGLALYWSADPLSRCGGQFEYPPLQTAGDLSTSSKQRYEQVTLEGLRIISFKWASLWLFFVLACLLNLWVATDRSSIDWKLSDPAFRVAFYVLVGGFILTVALSWATRRINQKARLGLCCGGPVDTPNDVEQQEPQNDSGVGDETENTAA